MIVMTLLFFTTLVGLGTLSHAMHYTRSNLGNRDELNVLAQIRKRGIAYNDPGLIKLFDDENSRIFWMYNWYSEPQISNTWQDYSPMLHDTRDEKTAIWFKDVDDASHKGSGDIHVFSFNEPDQCGQGGACMQDIGSTVDSHEQWVEPLRKYGDRMKIGAPAVSNGVRDQTTGSVMGLDWMSQFIDKCQGCKIDFVCIHWYSKASDVEYFKSHVQEAHEKANGRDVWITEFAAEGSNDEVKDFLRQVLPWLDNQDYIYRYAYQMAAKGSLINSDGTGLSDLGQVYNTYGW